MKTYNLFTNKEDTLPLGKADFLLAASVAKTAKTAERIVPVLNAEFLINEKIFSLGETAGLPIEPLLPSIINRAIHNLVPFSCIEILDLGLPIKPQNSTCRRFDIAFSDSIIDAKDIFTKGMHFGKNYELKGNYLILTEGILAQTTTLKATLPALGYECENNLLSSPSDSIMNNFEKLSLVSESMLIFCAGFLLEATRRFHVVLSGGIEMATCLLIADKLREDVFMRPKSANITLATTLWLAKNKQSDIQKLLSSLSYIPHAVYTDFSFAKTEIEVLKKYDDTDTKESLSIGAALAYGAKNGITKAQLLNEIELLIYGM